MKKLIPAILGLLLVACSLEPVLQVVERVAQKPGEVTKATEPERPSPTPTVHATPTLPPALPTSTRAPTPTPAPSTPTPSPTPTPPATPPSLASTPVTYVVQAGDTLARIAARFQVPVEAIAAENGIVDVNQIEVGQVLTLPAGAVALQLTDAPEAPVADTPVPTQTVAIDETAPEAEWNWPGICHPSPTEEGARVADLPIGESVDLTGYLYVKFVTTVSNERIVFSFCPAPYESYKSNEWADRCTIHAWIPRDKEGKPNHVKAYGTSFSSVVILDAHSREIRGWDRMRDSRPVRIVGTVIKPYGGPTGLGGSHTIDVVEIELLE